LSQTSTFVHQTCPPVFLTPVILNSRNLFRPSRVLERNVSPAASPEWDSGDSSMETRVDDVEKDGALHALLITLADAFASFKQMQGLRATETLCLATDDARRAVANKQLTRPDGRLRPHYASPLSSSACLSNADLTSRPYKIFAHPYFCVCSCLAFAWLPPPRQTASTTLPVR
jgi:hypothetical protein